jgi:hypothetical protein
MQVSARTLSAEMSVGHTASVTASRHVSRRSGSARQLKADLAAAGGSGVRMLTPISSANTFPLRAGGAVARPAECRTAVRCASRYHHPSQMAAATTLFEFRPEPAERRAQPGDQTSAHRILSRRSGRMSLHLGQEVDDPLGRGSCMRMFLRTGQHQQKQCAKGFVVHSGRFFAEAGPGRPPRFLHLGGICRSAGPKRRL